MKNEWEYKIVCNLWFTLGWVLCSVTTDTLNLASIIVLIISLIGLFMLNIFSEIEISWKKDK